MLRNYFLVAVRNLSRNKFFSAINIFGLAISMSICLGIIMLVADQLTYDSYNSKRDRIFRVVTRYVNADGSQSGNDYATSPLPLAEALVKDFTGVEKAVRIRRGFGNHWIEFDQNINVPLSGFFADPEVLDIFEHELEYGDPQTALVEPYSVVLTRKAANKLFSVKNPVGQVIKVGDLGEYKVTGVIREKDQKSHIVFEALASYATVASLEASKTIQDDDTWGNFTAGWVYFLAEPGHTPEEIMGHLQQIAAQQKPDSHETNNEHRYDFYLQNLSEITPGPFINNAIGPFMPMIFVYFFGGLALIVMLTSCFNYTNLSIARSLTRAREIGVRKVNGAQRYQIFLQFISESVVLALISLGVAMLLLVAVKPFMLNLQFARLLKWDLEISTNVYLAFLAFTVLVGLLAGFFPAVVLSKFRPVKVLKGAGSSVKLFSKIGLRKALLVAQFTLSLILIISVTLLYNQLTLFIRADHGFEMANKINVRLNNTSYEALRNELVQHNNIVSVAPASHVPAAGTTYGDGFKRKLSDDTRTDVSYFYTDANYLDNLDLKLLAGKNFNAQADETNKSSIIINESAAKAFHFETSIDAIGETIYMERDSTAFQIIGVVRDYNHQVLLAEIGPMALRFDPAQFHLLQVKYTGSYEEASRVVEQAWAKVNPSLKLDYKSFEDEIKLFYETVFSDFVSIIGVIAFLAITISCLGLLGMATYTIETRMKEISIRKILGSTDRGLVLLLSKSFIALITVAMAIPLAWLINNMWLELIAYHTELNLSVIFSSVVILLILAGLTIGSQTLRAAAANPVDNLRNE